MKDKKILIISNTTNGIYLFRRMLIKELLLNNQVVVLASDTGRVEYLKNMGCTIEIVEIDRRGTSVARDGRLFFTLFKHIKSINPDLILTYTIKPNIYGGFLSSVLHIPYAANITGLGTSFEKGRALKRFITILYKNALAEANTVFFENSYNREVLLREGIVTETQAYLLPGAGVDLSYFKLMPYPCDSTFRFLYIGRVMKEKGIDELILAMKRLIKEDKKCVLDVVGDCEDDYLKKIKVYVNKGWLVYHGKQSDVRPYILTADCFVLPSYHEGMANTNLECAASGRPIITSNIPGCREAVVKDESGLLCKARDAESLYESMKKMLGLTREERKMMGLAGRKKIEEEFDKTVVVKRTIERLSRIM